VPSDR